VGRFAGRWEPGGRCRCLENPVFLIYSWTAAAPGWPGFLPDGDKEHRFTFERFPYSWRPFGEQGGMMGGGP